jgi:hypothetical protein
MMNRNLLFGLLATAGLALTACEKGLVEDVADVAPTGQVSNSLLQITTRSGGGSTSDGTLRLTADPDWDSVNGYTF